MKKLILMASAVALMSCEQEQVNSDTGYSMRVVADNGAGKASSVMLTSGYANVTEVELEKEDDIDSLEVEVDIDGLYRFDLMTGVSSPAFPIVQIPAGTYHELEVKMGDDDSSLRAIHIEADYVDSNGVSTPIVIDVDQEVEFELEDEVNGIQVNANSVQQLNVVMGINAILGAIDWSLASQVNGQIVVDSQTNTVLYAQLVQLLNVECEVEDDD